jgi:hypothetical protein
VSRYGATIWVLRCLSAITIGLAPPAFKRFVSVAEQQQTPSFDRFVQGKLKTMAHLSDWHAFDPNDRNSYPKVVAPVQVRFEDGTLEEGVSLTFFLHRKQLPTSSIRAWRYIKGAVKR